MNRLVPKNDRARLRRPARQALLVRGLALLGLGLVAGAFPLRAETVEATVQRLGIQGALSKTNPAWVAALPDFGTIEWTVKELPFSGRGPRGGISGIGMVEVEGRIYLMGGFIPAGDETDDQPSRRTSRWTYCYDPSSDRWTRLPDLPARREYLRAIATPDAIYAMGGGLQEKPAPRYSAFSDVFRLSLARGDYRWSKAGNLTVPRTHMAAGAVGKYLIVAGGNHYDLREKGYSENTILGSVDVLDLSRPEAGWVQRAAIPGQRRGWTGSAALGGQFYLMGGLTFTKAGIERLQETLAYNPVKNEWTRRADPPAPISGWEADTYADRYIIAVGGVVGKENIWNDLPFVYDAKEDRWMKVESPLPPGALFNDPGVVVIGDTVYVVGAEGPRGTHFNYFLVGRIKVGRQGGAR